MASSYDYLLSLSPLEALVRMVNDQNGTNLQLDRFTASTPIAIGDTTTQVTLTAVPRSSSFDFETIQTTFTLTYDRLDLAIFLKGVVANYTPTLPLSTQNILDQITALIGQKFTIDDIRLEEVTRDNGAAYAVTAKPESLRFVGSIVLDLIALTDLSTLISATALQGITDVTPVVFPLAASTPYLNATDFRALANGFTVGDLAQNKANLVTLFNNVVPDPASLDNFAEAPWVATITPGPFNLYNASVAGYGSGLGINPAIPTLEMALQITLDGTYCTNFQSGTVTIPYTMRDFETDGYTAFPRLTAKSIVSLSDGTPWNVYLNGFIAGQVITSFQATPPVTMDGASAWVATIGLATPTNLYGATVLYNGQLRPGDLAPATQGLDRVLVVEMGIDNAVWQGTYAFYYTSPIPLIWKGFPLLSGTVGSFFQQDFTPTGGTGPFTYVITNGTLPAGLVLSGAILSGTLTTASSSFFDLTITDAVGTVVVFTVTMQVTASVQLLSINGTLPDAVINLAYTGFLDIKGGLLPYSGLSGVGGVLPPGLSFALAYDSIVFQGTPTVADQYPFALSVTSADGQTATRSFIFVVSATDAPLLLSGTFATGGTGLVYSSGLDITGGNGVYTNATVVSGTLPLGLTLAFSTVGSSKLLLEGTPTATGTYAFIVQIYSGDGQTVQSTQSITIVTG